MRPVYVLTYAVKAATINIAIPLLWCKCYKTFYISNFRMFVIS